MTDARGKIYSTNFEERQSQINSLSFCLKTWNNKISSEQIAAKILMETRTSQEQGTQWSWLREHIVSQAIAKL